MPTNVALERDLNALATEFRSAIATLSAGITQPADTVPLLLDIAPGTVGARVDALEERIALADRRAIVAEERVADLVLELREGQQQLRSMRVAVEDLRQQVESLAFRPASPAQERRGAAAEDGGKCLPARTGSLAGLPAPAGSLPGLSAPGESLADTDVRPSRSGPHAIASSTSNNAPTPIPFPIPSEVPSPTFPSTFPPSTFPPSPPVAVRSTSGHPVSGDPDSLRDHLAVRSTSVHPVAGDPAGDSLRDHLAVGSTSVHPVSGDPAGNSLRDHLAVRSTSVHRFLPDIEIFTGEDPSRAPGWFRRLDNFVSAQTSLLPGDAQRIGYLKSRLDGAADRWIPQWEQDNPTVGGSYLALRQALELAFRDRQQRARAVAAVQKMKQGSQTVQDYAMAFRDQAALTGYPPNVLLDCFRDGLDAEIRLTIAGYQYAPATYALYVDTAIATDFSLRQAMAMIPPSTPSTTGSVQGRPFCNKCGRNGHFTRDCRVSRGPGAGAGSSVGQGFQ